MLWKIGFFAFATLSPALLWAAEVTLVKPENAASYVDQEVTIEFTVKAGRLLAEKNVCFLNSEDSPRAEGNFTAFIGRKGLKAYKKDQSIDNPAEKFVGKKIRVTGKVKLHKDKAEIEVESPDQIEVVDEEKSGSIEEKIEELKLD